VKCVIKNGWHEIQTNNKNFSTDLPFNIQFAKFMKKSEIHFKSLLLLERISIGIMPEEEKNRDPYNIRNCEQEPCIDLDIMEEKAMSWKNNWLEICEIGKIKNFDVVIIRQPLLGAGNKPLSDGENKTITNFGHQSVVPAYFLIENAMDELSNECTATADFVDIFDGIDKPIYADLGHVGDFGNQLIAERMYDLIIPIILDELQQKSD